MKFNLKYLLVFLLATSLVSCEKFIGDDFNADPNNPVEVPVLAQMPAIQIAIADVYGGAFSRFNCMLSQQVEGVARQWASFNQYTGLTPNRFDAAWQNVYENILNEIKIAKESSNADGFNHLEGSLKVMEAYTLMMGTDVWDDMPYSSAFQGLENSNPTFDTQSDIYGTIYKLLDEGAALLAGPPGGTGIPNDQFYGGSASKWINAASAIRARALLHQKDYAGAASNAAAFSAASDNFAYQYPDANAAGQWYRFNRDRTGDIEFHPTMDSIMKSIDDTVRLAVLNTPFRTATHKFFVPNYLQEMVTYREMQFIIAEADVRANPGGTQAGYDAMVNGIKASFIRYGLTAADADTFIGSSAVPTVGNMSLESVMTHKYLSMFAQPEVYSDWRRTGFPTLEPVSGNAIPVRWHYSSAEYLFNSSAPSEGDVNIYTDNVGWDN